MPPKKARKANPKDYLWCDECGMAVHQSLAVPDEGGFLTEPDPSKVTCPKCGGELEPYHAER